MTENELLDKLNKIHKSKTQKEIEKVFDEVANKIFNKYLLVVNGNKYRITEIEFYYNDECDKNKHPAPYPHKHEKKKHAGEWRFHGSGIDIAIGGDGYYGGVLLRGLQNIKHHYDYIDGHLLVTDRILENANPINEIKKIIEKKEIFDSENSIYLIKKEQLPKNKIYIAPRVGLHPKRNEEKWSNFIMKNYRYLIYPEKTNNGKELLILSLKNNNQITDKISYVMQSKLKKYQTKYNKGEELRNNNEKEKYAKQIINEINTKFGVEKKCKLYGLLNEGEKK